MPSPAPIPIPSSQRWRDIRLFFLPPITFFLLVVTIFHMWRNYVHPPDLVGEVESVRANIISTQAGAVLELKVDYLQPVTNGQPLALISVMEPEILQAELKAIEGDLALMKARMAVDIDRNTENYEQMRLQVLSDKVQLSIDRTNLNLAEVEFIRAEQLFSKDLLISQEAYDIAKANRDALRVTVESRSAMVAQKEKTLATLDPLNIPHNDSSISAAIQAQQERLTSLNKPLVLKAPIDGFVSAINHRPGERIAAGLPILVISANKPDRIVGWVRQPILVRPNIGDLVEVRCRRLGGRTLQATVTGVGKQLEPISPAALPFNFSTPANRVEYGLQFLVSVPASTPGLIPGEMVGLSLSAKPARRSSN